MKSFRKEFTAASLAAFNLLCFSAAAQQGKQPGQAPVVADVNVSPADLLTQPPAANWTSYNGDYTGRRYSALHQITAANVARLRTAWIFHPSNSERLEVTPIVVRGVMYVTSGNDAWALDARTGRIIWHHERPVSSGLLDDAAGHKNRGVGVWRNFVYMETDDAHLLCLDARSGRLLWDITYAEKAKQYGATSAPLIVKDEVIVGTSGGDSGVRGFVAAYDAVTGKLKWRFWTIPGPGEFGSSSWPGDSYLHGGATTWMPGTYDPKLDTVYWTTSNAAPDFVGDSRPGDDLYTASVLALNPNTGALKWYFQFTPHDLYDYDANETPVLLSAKVNGRMRDLLVQANRNGFLYVLDRTDGKFLKATPFVKKLDWAKGIDASGRPILSGKNTHCGGCADLPKHRRSHELVLAFLQSRYRIVLRNGAGELQRLLRTPASFCPGPNFLRYRHKARSRRPCSESSLGVLRARRKDRLALSPSWKRQFLGRDSDHCGKLGLLRKRHRSFRGG